MTVNDNNVRLRHMLDAGHEIQGFVEGKEREALDTDQLLVRGLSMSISIIGEAASRISDETQQKYPDVPWAQIRGMRNRLIHAYFETDLDILWGTATQAIPQLIEQLEKIIAEVDDESEVDE
jgi:uncharacterized protein with HEPN domain